MKESVLKVVDNTNVFLVKCISSISQLQIGDILTVSVLEVGTSTGFSVTKGEVLRGLIVRTKLGVIRYDGSHVQFDENGIILVDIEGSPRGSRVFGPVPFEVGIKYPKLTSLITKFV